MKDPFANLNLTRGPDLRWGIIGMALAGIGLLVAGLLFVVPFGQTTYTAHFRYSGSIAAGDQVRIAGVHVGSVGGVELDGDTVNVTFRVDDDQRLGALTEAEVKLLTPVGGHYLAVIPKGDGNLADTPIPKERTITPYELTDVMESLVPVTTEISGDVVRQSIHEVNKAIDGQPDAIRDLMTQSVDLLSAAAGQSDQLERGMVVADEYVGAIAKDKALLAAFVRHLGGIAVKLADRRTNIITTFQSLKRIAAVVDRPLMAWGDHLEPVVSDAEEVFRTLLGDVTKIDDAIAGLREVIGSLGKMVGENGIEVDQSRTVVHQTALCVPLPGSTC